MDFFRHLAEGGGDQTGSGMEQDMNAKEEDKNCCSLSPLVQLVHGVGGGHNASPLQLLGRVELPGLLADKVGGVSMPLLFNYFAEVRAIF